VHFRIKGWKGETVEFSAKVGTLEGHTKEICGLAVFPNETSVQLRR